MIVAKFDKEIIKNKCVQIYNKITSNDVFIRCKTLLLDKFLFFIVFDVMVNMNLLALTLENYWRDFFGSLALLVPMSFAVTRLLQRLVPSFKLRIVYFLVLIFIAPEYSLDIIDLTSYALIAVIFLMLPKKKLLVLTIPLLFVATIICKDMAFVTVPYFIYLLINNGKDYPKLNITFQKDYVIVALIITIFAYLMSLFAQGVGGLNLLNNIILFFMTIYKTKSAFYLAIIMYAVSQYKSKKVTKQLHDLFMMILIYNLIDMLFYLSIPCFLAAFLASVWVINNASEIFKGIVKLDIKIKQKYLQILVVFIVIQSALDNIFYAPTAPLGFLYTSYYMSYFQFGFIQRGVLGTIFELILGTNMKKEVVTLSNFLWALMIVIVFLSVYFFVKANYKKTNGTVIAFLAYIALMLPILCFYPVDVLIYLMGILCVYLLFKNRVTVIFIPFICFAAMSTHQIFASLVFPLVFSLMVYRTFINSENHQVRNGFVLFITFFVVAAALVYFTYYNAQSIPFTAEEVIANINERSGGFFNVDEDFVKYVYLDKNHEHSEVFTGQIDDCQYKNALKVMLLLSPLFYIYLCCYRYSAKKETSFIKKFAYFICMLSFTVILPLFIRDTDFGRWCASLSVNICIMPALLLSIQPDDKKWYSANIKYLNPVIIYLIIILLILPKQLHWGLYRLYLEIW